MKRCPKCGREYDNTMMFCLDDGAELLYGPASIDEPAMAILSGFGVPPLGGSSSESPTRAQIHTTDQTAIFPRGTEAEPRGNLGDSTEKHSLSAHRAAKPLATLVVAIVVLVGGFFGYRYFGPANSKQIESIAVMPFVNDSGNADIEYLSDGMTETLMSSLTQVPNLQVKPRSSVFRYKGKETDPKTIGKELNVQAILNGRLVQRGNDITLYVELIDVRKDTLIWKGDYSRSMANLVSLQSEVARDVSNKLKTKLSGADVAKVEKGYTANPEAYRLYLQGRFYWNKRTGPDLKKSIEYFEQAITLDPAYALAYAGLADAYQVAAIYVADLKPEETYPKARATAQKALENDSNLAEPHAALGVVLHEYDWKQTEADVEFKRAIELDPNYASGHQWYGAYLRNMGRFDEAIAEGKRAIELDPLLPISYVALGSTYIAVHRYDDALAQFQKAREIEPNFPVGFLDLTYELKGMYEQLIDERRKAGSLSEKVAADLKEAYRTSGERGYWQKRLELAEESARAGNREVKPFEMARLQLQLGNKEQALDSLEKGVANGRGNQEPFRLRSNPILDPLRAEPRFKELLRKVGLPE